MKDQDTPKERPKRLQRPTPPGNRPVDETDEADGPSAATIAENKAAAERPPGLDPVIDLLRRKDFQEYVAEIMLDAPEPAPDYDLERAGLAGARGAGWRSALKELFNRSAVEFTPKPVKREVLRRV